MKAIIDAFSNLNKDMKKTEEEFGLFMQLFTPPIELRWYHKIPFYGASRYRKDIEVYLRSVWKSPQDVIDIEIERGSR